MYYQRKESSICLGYQTKQGLFITFKKLYIDLSILLFIIFIFLQMNVGGAFDRPVPADIWTVVQNKLDNPDDDTPIDYGRLRVRGAGSVCTIL